MSVEDEFFAARAAREDQLALAAEREELRKFLADFNAWLDGVVNEPPNYPTPETLHAIPTRP